MSSPRKRMVPLSVATLPEIWPISVVLPAPFGPMSACTSPAATSRPTSSVATTPPKRLETSLRLSMPSSGEQAGNSLRSEENDHEQHDADAEVGMLLVIGCKIPEPADRVIRDEMLQPEQHRG